ncbi:rhamnosyltransferase WsaF family glycosyltransferase [Lichenifustis flavocetrariae]|uniref:Glycosyl transferase family 1 domain-containing protein n=1 Tax=Lichenifustis flavocetrariae TaxID=2949735 RepID=A0AA41YWT4_9HYPH|nr:hypothetical protein [Lichenifustis flavocetrariae]MCW6509564.1 hypothetical protein [Lichenifustis flavocetrariae]
MSIKEFIKARVKSQLAARNNYKVTGIPPMTVVAGASNTVPRLNLVVMGIRKGALFGGADTAIRLFDAVSPHFQRHRLIVQSEAEDSFDTEKWAGWDLDSKPHAGSKTIAFQKQPNFVPQIDESDHFIATNWMSAMFVRSARRVQSVRRPSRFIYMIQDYEPGFYPWSGRHLLARATYVPKDDAIAVFNTQLLHDYFVKNDIVYPMSYAFEPRLSPSLAKHLGKLAGHKKRKLMLVYGRPGTGRNAFDMVVEALENWSRTDPNAGEWELVSLGEKHRDIKLAKGLVLRSRGKVPLDQYASYLLDAAVGFSLMASPHPSYPPLEMAEFGALVVTNTFDNKDLSQRVGNIRSVVETTPVALAAALQATCEEFSRTTVPASAARAFLGGEVEFPFLPDLVPKFLEG